MASSLTLTVGEALAVLGGLVGLIVTIVGLVGGWVWRSQREIHGRINRSREDLATFRIEVAQNYVTAASIVRIEEKLIKAIGRLSDKLDRFITKI